MGADHSLVLELLGLLTLVALALGVAAVCSMAQERIATRGDELRFHPDDVAELEMRFSAVLRERAGEL